MPKFIIRWEAGSGSYDGRIVDAKDEEAARLLAYEAWRQCAEDNADYGVVPYTPEAAEKYDVTE